MESSKAEGEGPFLTPEEEREAEMLTQLARSLAFDALERFKPHLTPEGYALLEASLLFELTATPAGRASLARLLPAPVVDRSGEVLKGAEPGAARTRRDRAKAGSDR